MNINLFQNNSENNCINKQLIPKGSTDAIIKGNINVVNPVLILSYNINISEINYIYIPEYNRYYFCEITNLTGNRIELNCNVDVLESFKNFILSQSCVIDKQAKISNANKYINDGSFVVQSNEANYILNFPDGFNETGTYILICAGG